MKRFLIKFIWYFLPILVFLIAVEWIIRSVPNDYKYKWSYLENHSREIEVLVLGNSQSLYGIDCNVLKPISFNMAMEGQGLLIDDFILETFIKSLTRLRAVILPMSYLSLTQPEAFGSPGRLMQYHIYYGYDSKWYSIDNYECLNSLLCSEKIKTLITGRSLNNVDSLGFLAHPASQFRNDADETLLWATGGSEQLVETNRKALAHMASLCEKKGVSLVLVSFPTDISYRLSNRYDPSQMDRVNNVAYRLSLDYKNVYWYNWSDNPLFDNSDYFDSSHLNIQGAINISNLLNRSLQEIGVI